MNEKHIAALGQLLGPVVWTGILLWQRRSRLRRTNELILNELNSSYKRENYLATKLDEAGVEMDEFDAIVYYNL